MEATKKMFIFLLIFVSFYGIYRAVAHGGGAGGEDGGVEPDT